MRITSIIIAFFFLACSTAIGQNLHNWDAIRYPNLPTHFGSGTASAKIRHSEDGIRFIMGFSWSNDDAKKANFEHPNGSEIELALHYADNSIVGPSTSTFDGKLKALNERGVSYGRFSCTFPWGENEMVEAWLRVSAAGRDYWFQIPYGFTRDPKLEKLPTAKTGPPELPPALKGLSENSQIVNWKYVFYNLGEIQNGWRLSLQHANPFDANSEIILYRDDSAEGKSRFLWDIHEPKTTLSIKHENGLIRKSHLRCIRLHDDGYRRSDSFQFGREVRDEFLRGWGTMVIEVGEKRWTTTVPSSLFKYGHGCADHDKEFSIR